MFKARAITLVILVLALASWATLAREKGHGHDDNATVKHGFEGAERWSRHFDAPERAAWQKPDEVIAFLGLEGSEQVVDLGAGTGYFTLPLARALGEGGAVIALDIESEMLAFIEKRADESGLRNISTLLARPDDPLLEAASADLVICVNTWHHIDARRDYARRLAAALKPGGRVVIIDFKEGDLPVGPPAGHKLAPAKVSEEFEDAGFEQAASFEGLEYQYMLVFSPPA